MTFHATCAYDMDDKLEMQFGYDFVKSFLTKYDRCNCIPYDRRLSLLMPSLNTLITLDNKDEFFQPKEYTPFVICFSKGYNDEYMWEHYGDNHKGVCMAFDEQDLLKLSENSERGVIYNVVYTPFENQNMLLAKAMAVYMDKHLKEFYTLYPFFINQEYRNRQKIDILNQFCTLISAGIKTGSEDYDYYKEKEVRWISVEHINSRAVHLKNTENDKKVHYIEERFPLSCLKAIYIGKECILSEAKKRNFQNIYGYKLQKC